MKPLVLVFHLDLAASRVNRAWAKAAEEVAPVRIVGPDFEPDAERAACEAASALVFQHPMHWYSAPWTLKKWLDLVPSYGWAYGDRQALASKPWLSAVSVGAGAEDYGPGTPRAYTVEEFLRPFESSAAFLGMEWQTPFLLYGAGYASEDAIRTSAQAYQDRLRALDR